MTAYLTAFPKYWEWPAELPAGDGTVATLSWGQKEVLVTGSTASVDRAVGSDSFKLKTQVNGVTRLSADLP